MSVLKHINRPLVRFSWNPDRRSVRIREVVEENRNFLPLDIRDSLTDEALARWLRHRAIPGNRAYVENFLAKQGLGLQDTQGILGICKGLSLADVHWVDDESSPARFADVDLFHHPFRTLLAALAFTGKGSYGTPRFQSSPEYTTHGALAKCWRRVGGRILLFKAGSSGAANTGNEPLAEFYAAQVAEVLGVPHVPYGLSRFKDRLCSTCPLFTSPDVSFIPLSRMLPGATSLEGVLSGLEKLGAGLVPQFQAVLLLDALLCNPDRHLGNLGVLVGNRENRILRMAPAFDHGLALFPFAMEDDWHHLEAYSRVKRPPLYAEYLEPFRQGVPPEFQKRLATMDDFRFRRHPRVNWPDERLRCVEEFLRRRSSSLRRLS